MADDTKKTLEERLTAARARSESAQKKLDDTRMLQEVEAEEKAADLREKHGSESVALVHTLGGPVVLLRPGDLAWKAWERAVNNAGKNPISDKAVERLAKPCVEYPDYDKLIEATPAVLADIIVAIGRLCGAKAAEDLGK